MGKKGDNTTTTSTAPNPAAMSAYQSLLDRAGGVASSPFTAYGGDLTAGINAQQQAGFGNINQNANFASPFIQQGAQYATSLGQGPTQANLDAYMNPFQQNVVDATQAQFNRSNASQQNDLRSRAASQGALGGSRANVAAGDLAYQQQLGQAPAIANLYAQNYNQAVGNWGQNARFASGQMGNLGVSGQQAALAGAGAQVGAGSLQQQTEQQRLSALYNQFQIQQAFPYQQTQWLAGLQTGVGSQMGGTSNTTGPAPNPFAQYAGPALMAASFFHRGGGVHGYDEGGAVDPGISGTPWGGVNGFIPGMNLTRGQGAPPPPKPPQQQDPTKGLRDAMSFMKGQGGQDEEEGVAGAPDWWSPAPHEGDTGVWQGPSASEVYRSGGVVRGYADGGSPDDDLSFDDRFDPAYSKNFDISGDIPNLPEPGTADAVPLPRSRPEMAGVSGAPPTSDGSGWEPAPREGAPSEWQGVPQGVAGPAASAATAKRKGLFGLIPDDMRAPLFAAGASMAASRSPFLGNAIGEAGLAGFGAYQRAEEKTADRSIRKQSLDMQSRRLDEAAQRARETLALRTRALDEQTAYRKDALEARQDAAERSRYQRTDQTLEDGTPVNFDPKTGQYHNSATGEVINQSKTKVVNPKTEGLLSPEAVEQGAHQMAQGNLSPMTNLGNGLVASRNKTALRNKATDVLVSQGMTPQQAAEYQNSIEQRWRLSMMAQGASARTAGNRLANLGMIIEVTDAAVPAAIEASDKVGRTGWTPVNRIIRAGKIIASDPDQRVFGMANLQLAEAWAKAMNPTGVMRESDRDLALEYLSEADSPSTYKTLVGQLQKQIGREREGVQKFGEQYGLNRGAPKPGTTEGGEGKGAAPIAPKFPQGAVDKLKANPSLAPMFDQKYGAGSSSAILGQ